MRSPKTRDKVKDYSLYPIIPDYIYECGYCNQELVYSIYTDPLFSDVQCLRLHCKYCKRHAFSQISIYFINLGYSDVVKYQIQVMVEEYFTPIDPDKLIQEQWEEFQREFEYE